MKIKNKLKQITGWFVMASFLLAGCSGSENGDGQSADKKSQNETGLTEFEQKHGIGPVKEVITIGEIDREQVEMGKEIFRTKCSACHKMDKDYVGPPLGNVLEKRTPAYAMNMILNPVEMTKKHPEAKKMLQQYMNQMTFQNVSREQARAIVEYLASLEIEEENQSN